MKKGIALLLIACIAVIAHAQQNNWQLKKDKDGIKVYTAAVEGSNIKAIKVNCTVDASLSQLAALLLDTKAHEQWVYNTRTSYLVKQLSPRQQLYYSEIKMPWPLANRDAIIELSISQDPVTRVLNVTANTVANNSVELKKDKVRIPLSKVKWTVTPLNKDHLNIEYIAQADPGGAIPAWVVNLFSTKGPFETFKNLKVLASSAVYKNAKYDFIKD